MHLQYTLENIGKILANAGTNNHFNGMQSLSNLEALNTALQQYAVAIWSKCFHTLVLLVFNDTDLTQLSVLILTPLCYCLPRLS